MSEVLFCIACPRAWAGMLDFICPVLYLPAALSAQTDYGFYVNYIIIIFYDHNCRLYSHGLRHRADDRSPAEEPCLT